MAKVKTRFVCQKCGYQAPKWMGRCPDCGSWNSMVEEVVDQAPAKGLLRAASSGQAAAASNLPPAKAERLDQVDPQAVTRIDTGIGELNRVLGGGLVPGELVLLSGDPGIGKSTLTMQLMQTLEGQGNILYISGEESKGQIRNRAARLGVTNPRIRLLCESNVLVLDATIRDIKPDLLIVDSVQTVFDPELQSVPGSIAQLRAVTGWCMTWAKGLGIPTILIGHVTKEGNVAGPRVLEHMVDAVLFIEGDRQGQYRVLRGLKNRFGSTNEIGLFDMTSEGLVEVTNASQAFLSERPEGVSGSAVTATMEGKRPIMVEMQALVTKSFYGQPRCMTTGVKYDRVSMLTAVLEKRCGLRLGDQDIYLNVVGGLRVEDPSCDLAIAAAIASSYGDKSIDRATFFCAEIGLTGELRQARQLTRRLEEARQLGFSRAIVARQTKPVTVDGMEIVQAAFLSDVLSILW
jgi:DNA repair protein RadA/Sms